jgi:hypothetical protein
LLLLSSLSVFHDGPFKVDSGFGTGSICRSFVVTVCGVSSVGMVGALGALGRVLDATCTGGGLGVVDDCEVTVSTMMASLEAGGCTGEMFTGAKMGGVSQ